VAEAQGLSGAEGGNIADQQTNVYKFHHMLLFVFNRTVLRPDVPEMHG